jgi:hypothetical protein
MMFGWFDWRPPSYRTYLSHNTVTWACTGWYGHRFEKFSATVIFCPACGTTKNIRGEG